VKQTGSDTSSHGFPSRLKTEVSIEIMAFVSSFEQKVTSGHLVIYQAAYLQSCGAMSKGPTISTLTFSHAAFGRGTGVSGAV